MYIEIDMVHGDQGIVNDTGRRTGQKFEYGFDKEQSRPTNRCELPSSLSSLLLSSRLPLGYEICEMQGGIGISARLGSR